MAHGRQEPRLKKIAAPGEAEKDLKDEIAALRRELARLNGHKFMRIQNSTARLLWTQFLRGLAMGLGTVVGASALVSFLVFLLTQIDFIPIIGEWASEIASEIQDDLRDPGSGTEAQPTDGSN